MKVVYAFALFSLMAILGYFYTFAHSNGAESVQIKWDKEKKETNERIHSLENTYTLLTIQHTKISEGLRHDIQKLTESSQAELDRVKSDYVSRLHSSETRASLYKRQASAGASECRGLADYATELDRTLESGRDLVQQLRITLRQREREIGLLSTQLLTDRDTLKKAGSINER